MGLVGESGCGKSTLGRMIAGILPQTTGAVLVDGKDTADMSSSEQKAAALAVQMIFQDPFASLNPRMRVEQIIGEAPLVHGLTDRAALKDYVDDIMMKVGLDPSLNKTTLPASVLGRAATTNRDRPCTRSQATVSCLRRSDCRTRCVNTGAGVKPLYGFA